MTNEYLMGDKRHRPPIGWKCIIIDPHHDGPCAAVPRWWNFFAGASRYRKSR